VNCSIQARQIIVRQIRVDNCVVFIQIVPWPIGVTGSVCATVRHDPCVDDIRCCRQRRRSITDGVSQRVGFLITTWWQRFQMILLLLRNFNTVSHTQLIQRYLSIFKIHKIHMNTIRFDMIEEFSMDSKAECTGPSSAFKKWSGHVVQKCSRIKGCLGISPEKNLDSPRF